MLPNSPLTPQSGPTGAMSPQTPNPGVMAASLSKVGIAVQILQEALPGLPMGEEVHKAVLDSITKLSKVSPPSGQIPGVQATELRGLEQTAQRQGMLQALTRALGMGGDGGGAPPPGGPMGGPPPEPGPPGGMM